MGKEGGRNFGIRPAMEAIKDQLMRANPLASYVRESLESRRLRNLSGTKAHADAVRGEKIPFDDVEGHRKMRGLK